jgi:hypothetical protein
MDGRRVAYWGIAGGLIGLGIIGILSIGIFLIVAGLLMVLFGLLRLGPRHLWAALIGSGALPALVLAYDVLTAPPLCPAGTISVPYGSHAVICGGPTTGFMQLALIFGGIALLGVLWPLAPRLVRWVWRPRAHMG